MPRRPDAAEPPIDFHAQIDDPAAVLTDADARAYWAANGITDQAALNCERAARWLAAHRWPRHAIVYSRRLILRAVEDLLWVYPGTVRATIWLQWLGGDDWRTRGDALPPPPLDTTPTRRHP